MRVDYAGDVVEVLDRVDLGEDECPDGRSLQLVCMHYARFSGHIQEAALLTYSGSEVTLEEGSVGRVQSDRNALWER